MTSNIRYNNKNITFISSESNVSLTVHSVVRDILPHDKFILMTQIFKVAMEKWYFFHWYQNAQTRNISIVTHMYLLSRRFCQVTLLELAVLIFRSTSNYDTVKCTTKQVPYDLSTFNDVKHFTSTDWSRHFDAYKKMIKIYF